MLTTIISLCRIEAVPPVYRFLKPSLSGSAASSEDRAAHRVSGSLIAKQRPITVQGKAASRRRQRAVNLLCRRFGVTQRGQATRWTAVDSDHQGDPGRRGVCVWRRRDSHMRRATTARAKPIGANHYADRSDSDRRCQGRTRAIASYTNFRCIIRYGKKPIPLHPHLSVAEREQRSRRCTDAPGRRPACR